MVKRRQFRIEHGMEEETHERPSSLGKDVGVGGDDGQSPVAVEGEGDGRSGNGAGKEEYVDFEGKRRPVKKWLGIW